MGHYIKKYEGKLSYPTPWGNCVGKVDGGNVVVEMGSPNVGKYIMKRYGFKPYTPPPPPAPPAPKKKPRKRAPKKTTTNK